MNPREDEMRGGLPSGRSLFDDDPALIRTMDRFASEMNLGGLADVISKNLRGPSLQREILLRTLHAGKNNKVRGEFKTLQDGTIVGLGGQDGFILSVQTTEDGMEHPLGIISFIDSRNLPLFPDAIVPEPPALEPAFPIIVQVQGPSQWWYANTAYRKEQMREVMAEFRWPNVLTECTEKWTEGTGFERIGILSARCVKTDTPVGFAYLSSRFDGLAVTRKYDALDFSGVHIRNFPPAR